MAELLVWPALIAYGEAAFAYAGELRGPGRYGRFGIWGVRIGWLAQTALLVAQALSTDGFPWGTWAGALNLLSWLVVSGYLVWGCKPRYRLIGLLVMPLAAALLVLAWAGGGTGVHAAEGGGWTLDVHVGLMLAAMASFTVAAAMALLYLFEERRLKRRDAAVLRLRLPSLEALDRLASRVAFVGLGAPQRGHRRRSHPVRHGRPRRGDDRHRPHLGGLRRGAGGAPRGRAFAGGDSPGRSSPGSASSRSSCP